jgi:hypothetical protein
VRADGEARSPARRAGFQKKILSSCYYVQPHENFTSGKILYGWGLMVWQEWLCGCDTARSGAKVFCFFFSKKKILTFLDIVSRAHHRVPG